MPWAVLEDNNRKIKRLEAYSLNESALSTTKPKFPSEHQQIHQKK